MNNKVKQELERIEIPKELHMRTKLGVKKAKLEHPKGKFKNRLVIPLVASLSLVFSIGVGAATIPSFNHLLSLVSPEIALMLQPIEISSEDNGIKMEVVAAMNDDEMAVIYVTMQDLTGNRIDKTLDIYDYSLTEGRMFNSQIVDYDDTTNTATLRIQANGGESINNKKIGFHITSFLSHKQTMEEVIVDANLMEVKNNTPQMISLDTNNVSGGGEIFGELMEQDTIKVLKPDETELSLPEIEFMHISNLGFIDNRLHIQTKWTGDNVDDHGYFYFMDASGDKIHASNIYFESAEVGKTNDRNEYIEYIFDVDQLDLDKLKLMGDFVYGSNYTIGNWSTTFKIQSVSEEKNMNFSKDFGTWTANRITVTPLGVTVYGEGEVNHSNEIVVSAKMNDGSVQTFDSMTSFSENEKVKAKFISSLPLDISKIESINIDGIEIDF